MSQDAERLMYRYLPLLFYLKMHSFGLLINILNRLLVSLASHITSSFTSQVFQNRFPKALPITSCTSGERVGQAATRSNAAFIWL